MPQLYRKQNNIEGNQKNKETQATIAVPTYFDGIRNAEKFQMLLKSKFENEKKKIMRSIEKKKNRSCIIWLFRCLYVFLSSHEHF